MHSLAPFRSAMRASRCACMRSQTRGGTMARMRPTSHLDARLPNVQPIRTPGSASSRIHKKSGPYQQGGCWTQGQWRPSCVVYGLPRLSQSFLMRHQTRQQHQTNTAPIATSASIALIRSMLTPSNWGQLKRGPLFLSVSSLTNMQPRKAAASGIPRWRSRFHA